MVQICHSLRMLAAASVALGCVVFESAPATKAESKAKVKLGTAV